MGKFLVLIKKWFGGFRGEDSSGAGAPATTVKPQVQYEIERDIDYIVFRDVQNYGHLMNFRNEITFWQSVFKALAYAESGFNRLCRYVEPPSLGKDAVTGKQNTSEGLLQLSYQDSKYHQCNFNWDEDKNKKPDDSTKTIFDIEANITCGLAIMNKLVSKKGHYIFDQGNYWAVLKPSNKRHQVFLNKFYEYQGRVTSEKI